MPPKKVDLRALEALAREVAAEHEEQRKAIDEQCEVEATALARLIARAKPALPAISNPLPRHVHDERPDLDEHFPEQGVLLQLLRGTRWLAVRVDGTLVTLTDSTPPDHPEESHYDLAPISYRDAMRYFDFDKAAGALQDKLLEQRGARKNAAAVALARAAELRKRLAEELPDPAPEEKSLDHTPSDDDIPF